MSTTVHASATPPSSTTTTLPSSSIVPGIAEHSSFKNLLQEYTQRACIPFPSYTTVNLNGPCQLPQFRSCVAVDGETFTSLSTYSNKKAAEQDAAKVALEGIYKKTKDCISKKTSTSGFPPIFQDKVFCKSILHEFAAKYNMEKPKYDTVKLEGLVSVFRTSVFFNGVKYVGSPSLNKKEAEQLAARVAILSILADSGIGMQLSEVVKSKAKFFAFVHEDFRPNECPAIPSVQPNVEATLETPAIKGDNRGTSQTDSGIGMQLSEVVKSKAKLFAFVHEDFRPNECPAIPSVQPNVEATLETPAIKGDDRGTSQTDSGIGMQLSEVVKSKAKLFAFVHEDFRPNECPAIPSVKPNVEATLETPAIKGDDPGTSQTDCATGNVVVLSVLEQSSSEKGGLEDAGQASNVIENVVCGDVEGQSHDVPIHEFRKHEVETSPPADPHLIELVPSHFVSGIIEEPSHSAFKDESRKPEPYTYFHPVPLPIAFGPLFEEKISSSASACGQKRKSKKKKKADKKAKEEIDTTTQVTELHLNQGLI